MRAGWWLWAILGLSCSKQPAPPPVLEARPTAPADSPQLDPTTHWRGFVEMMPPVAVSQRAGGLGRVAVRLRLEPGTRIRARFIEEQQRYTLDFPPGAVADRVSLRGRYEGGAQVFTVGDVRGARVAQDGVGVFHVYRPISGERDAPLLAWRWRPGASEAADRERSALLDHVAATPRAFADAPPSDDYVRFFARMNACERCHEPDEARSGASTPWATDGEGWFTPLAVLTHELALSTTSSFHDPSADDPFVTKRCGDEPALERGVPGATYYECADGSLPLGTRDVPAGLAAEHPYTLGLCRSRRYLYEHMEAEARAAFARAFDECGLE